MNHFCDPVNVEDRLNGNNEYLQTSKETYIRNGVCKNTMNGNDRSLGENEQREEFFFDMLGILSGKAFLVFL